MFIKYTSKCVMFCHFLSGSHVMTVSANDRDQGGTTNSTFHYELEWFFPKPPHTEFFVNRSGEIYFKGCLDYQAREYMTWCLCKYVQHARSERCLVRCLKMFHM